MLMGPHGFFEMPEGVIRAGIHVHMSPVDAKFYEVEHKQMMNLRVHGPCQTVFEKVLVRVDPAFKLEVHMDTDESNGCGLDPSTFCELFL
jgi:putative phosphotransacetylase